MTLCLTEEVFVVVNSDVLKAEKEEKKKRQLASVFDSHVVKPSEAALRVITLQGRPGEHPAAAKKRG